LEWISLHALCSQPVRHNVRIAPLLESLNSSTPELNIIQHGLCVGCGMSDLTHELCGIEGARNSHDADVDWCLSWCWCCWLSQCVVWC
jgi:hypothetical protein